MTVSEVVRKMKENLDQVPDFAEFDDLGNYLTYNIELPKELQREFIGGIKHGFSLADDTHES